MNEGNLPIHVGPAAKPANKGFLSHYAAIITSGMNGGSKFANPVFLTAYGSQADALKPGSLYSMNCKLIGTNDGNNDHLHFENANRVNFGSVENIGINVTNEMMDKVSMVALGIIVAKDTVKDPFYKGKSTVVVTVKHTDYDPFTRMSVTWCTKHFVPPARNMESAQSLCVIGREAQFTGYIRDYDAEKFMWECEACAISVTSGHLTTTPPTPTKSMGRPNGGRIALSSSPIQQNVTEELLSDPYTSANAIESSSGSGSNGPDETGSVSSSIQMETTKLGHNSTKRTRRE
ncbi:hypothetical protein DFH28DRAFT_1129012 [Melampsora americana]|nr:hypothetical protein DFH28DRAFT_1129012 [Melampsora americana]